MHWTNLIGFGLFGAAIGGGLAWYFFRRASRRSLRRAHRDAAQIRDEAGREAETRIREAEVAAREKLLAARSEFEELSGKHRKGLEAKERELGQREDRLQRSGEELDRDRHALKERLRQSEAREKQLEESKSEVNRVLTAERQKLEKTAGLSSQQAKEELMRVMEEDARMEAAHAIKRIEDEARESAAREAQRITGIAVQRAASDYVAETTVSVVNLPNDDMKGRIIGREGRNIRALEAATGVDLIVDDTPEAVILSGFDPLRREIARESLERLIADGRIHPGRIEDVVGEVKAQFDELVREAGADALLEMNIPSMDSELVYLLGRLKFRTSYGQNVLQHSKDVAFLAATMAHELNVDAEVAKRAGLLHDIGKAVDREMEGGHLQIGVDLLRKYGESEEVVHAMACHHGDYEPHSVEAVLVTAADALSAARPGARREGLEAYLKRLERLENLAADFKGVDKSYAIQAGREIRVIVDAQSLSDEQSEWLSRDVAKRIESELTYPGEIKVTVIREMRAVGYAR